VQIGAGIRADSPFAAWCCLFEAQDAWGKKEHLPPLLTHFGTSFVERALIEAVCRRIGRCFFEAAYTNLFGIRLGDIHPALKEAKPSDFLTFPIRKVIARHTVGLADPLCDAD